MKTHSQSTAETMKTESMKTHRIYSMFLPCQSGKTRQMIRAIQRNYDESEKRPIPIVLSTNHSQLTIQTAMRLHKSLGSIYKIFVLNSMNPYRTTHLFKKDTIVYNPPTNAMTAYIDRFVDPMYPNILPPIILALSNNNQVEKVCSLIETIDSDYDYPFDMYFDEADVTYSQYRTEWNSYMYRANNMILITATPQKLMEFDEIKESVQPYPVEYDKAFYDLYLNHLDNDAVIYHANPDPMATFDANMFIYKTIQRNYHHFADKLDDGSYRRILAVTSHRVVDHEELAAMIIEDYGFNVLTVNGEGVILHRSEKNKKVYPVKKEFSEVLASINGEADVKDKPLVIVGNRRIDRGVTFQNPSKEFLVRDIIISPGIKSNNIPRMVQVLGRIAGYIKGALINKDDKINIFLTESQEEPVKARDADSTSE